MIFSELRRKVNLTYIKNVTYNPSEVGFICAQYNPDNYIYWRRCINYIITLNTELCIYNSPHTDFAKYIIECGKTKAMNRYTEFPYYKLQQLYGRSDKWIYEKMLKFVHIILEIKENGKCNEMPVLLNKPLMENVYNKGPEIWEGHHRIAACYSLGISCIISLNKWSLING